MPARKQDPPAAPDVEPEQFVLDAWSFNAAERHECQVQFDTEFGDLLEYLFKVVRPVSRWVPQPVFNADGELQLDADGKPVMTEPTGPLTVAIVDRSGRRWFSDEILSFFCWVQAKRDRPDAELAEFVDMSPGDLTSAHLGGLLKKVRGGTGSSTRQRRSPAS